MQETLSERTSTLCLGLSQGKRELAKHRFLMSQTPYPRKISKLCRGSLKGEGSLACEECQKLEELENEAVQDMGYVCSPNPSTEASQNLAVVHSKDIHGRVTPNIPDIPLSVEVDKKTNVCTPIRLSLANLYAGGHCIAESVQDILPQVASGPSIDLDTTASCDSITMDDPMNTTDLGDSALMELEDLATSGLDASGSFKSGGKQRHLEVNQNREMSQNVAVPFYKIYLDTLVPSPNELAQEILKSRPDPGRLR